MGKNVSDRTGGTSSACASGNPPVVFYSGQEQPEFLTNRRILAELRKAGYADAGTNEARYLLNHVSYQHILPYLKAAKAWSPDSGIKRASDMLSFDRLMQAVVFRFIGIIEAQMRAQYSQAMAERHGSLSVYDKSLFLREERYMRSRGAYDDEVRKKAGKNRKVRSALEQNDGMLPIWLGVECMTMGTLFNLYSNTADTEVTARVADSFGASKDELANWSKTLTEVRNICAHFEPLFIRKQLPSVPKLVKGGPSCPRRSPLYSAVIIAHLLRNSIETYDRPLKYGELFKLELRETIEEFERFTGNHVPIPGFPFNWRAILSACE